MNKQILEVLEEASADAERNRDTLPPEDIRPQRRNGSGSPVILSVRLTTEQHAQLAARAEKNGKPVSAEARDILLAALEISDDDTLGKKLEQVLRRTLNPEVLNGTA